MKRKGSELIFIGRIEREGLAVTPISEQVAELFNDEHFNLIHLSITYDTYIAVGMTCFIVKLKKL